MHLLSFTRSSLTRSSSPVGSSPLNINNPTKTAVQTAANWRSHLCPCVATFLPREAMISAVYAVLVCLSLCVSDTLRYCIKTAKRRITQTTPRDSPLTLVFWHQRSWRNSNGITPYGGDKCRWGGLKLFTFDEKRAITRKRYKIDV